MKKKTPRLSKKLLLHKERIAMLNDIQKNGLAGGNTTEISGCASGCLTVGLCHTKFGETCVC